MAKNIRIVVACLGLVTAGFFITKFYGDGSRASAAVIIPLSNLGDTNIEANSDTGDANSMKAVKYTMPNENGTASSMSVYVGSVDPSPNSQYSMAIYSDNFGVPGNLIASTDTGTLTANSWNSLPITGELMGNASYWLAYNNNGTSSSSNNWKVGPGSIGQLKWKAQTFGTWPQVYGTATGALNMNASIYVTYVVLNGTPPPPPSSSCITSYGAWQNTAFASQNGGFSAQFDVIPNGAVLDSVTGLSNGSVSDFPNLAAIVLFSGGKTIQARNGANYSALTTVTYSPGLTYHIRMEVNVSAHTYSVYVTPPLSGEITIATNYAFRMEQNTVTTLNNWAFMANGVDNHTVCNFNIGAFTPPPTPTPPPAPTPTPTPPPAPLPPPPPVSTKFTIGQQVQTNTTVNVRQTAAGSLLGTQPNGVIGTVTSGPISAVFNGAVVIWWNINFNTGIDGWVGEDVLIVCVKTSPPPPPAPLPPPPPPAPLPPPPPPSVVPTGADGSVVFIKNSAFATSPNFIWDNVKGFLGIGTSTPGTQLEVLGNIMASGKLTINNIAASAKISAASLDLAGDFNSTGNVTAGNISGNAVAANSLSVAHDAAVTGNLNVGGLISTGGLALTGNFSTLGNITGANITATNSLTVGGDFDVDGNLHIGGQIFADAALVLHSGSANQDVRLLTSPGGSVQLSAGFASAFGQQGGQVMIEGGSSMNDLGGFIQIKGGDSATGNGGYIELVPGQSTNHTGIDGTLRIKGSNGTLSLNTSNLLGLRTITFPDASGTVSLLSLDQTFTGLNKFEGATNSTIYVGSQIKSGCIAVGDDDGGGVTYITAHRGALKASEIKPNICQ